MPKRRARAKRKLQAKRLYPTKIDFFSLSVENIGIKCGHVNGRNQHKDFLHWPDDLDFLLPSKSRHRWEEKKDLR
jgi:hypothetical protein